MLFSEAAEEIKKIGTLSPIMVEPNYLDSIKLQALGYCTMYELNSTSCDLPIIKLDIESVHEYFFETELDCVLWLLENGARIEEFYI